MKSTTPNVTIDGAVPAIGVHVWYVYVGPRGGTKLYGPYIVWRDNEVYEEFYDYDNHGSTIVRLIPCGNNVGEQLYVSDCFFSKKKAEEYMRQLKEAKANA